MGSHRAELFVGAAIAPFMALSTSFISVVVFFHISCTFLFIKPPRFLPVSLRGEQRHVETRSCLLGMIGMNLWLQILIYLV